MNRARMEAFSDGVIAVIITIMVLELQVPESTEWQALYAMLPKFMSYVLSFIYVGLYWNNHHHMLHYLNKVNGKILWSNLFFLFCLSLLPFGTAWMGEHHFEQNTTVFYGVLLVLVAVAYTILAYRIKKQEGKDSAFVAAVGANVKEKISVVLYIAGIISSFFFPYYIALGFYYFVALMWIVPDRRLEKAVGDNSAS